MEEDVSSCMHGISVFEVLSEQELGTVQAKLWKLLARISRLYTMDDSSSVRVETAQELLTSICFTLDVYLKETGNSQKLLATSELEVLLESGRIILQGKIEEGKRLWQAACVSAPKIDNLSFLDTLRSIGGFFQRYDLHYFAHQIPCEIDYQLGLPLPDTVQGILYINEYLRRILAENGILQQFDNHLVIQLLKSYCRDYRGLLINLCEPVLTNALGLALIGDNPSSLQITDVHRSRLLDQLIRLTESELHSLLNESAQRLCLTVGISDPFIQQYVDHLTEELSPRIQAALSTGNLTGIFLSFS